MAHRVEISGTGGGKSSNALVELVALARKDGAILLCDPHGPLARAFMEYLVRLNLDHRVIYDRLTDTDRVLGWKFFRRPETNDAKGRLLEDELIHGLMDVFLWRRGSGPSHETPFFERGLLFALRLLMRQETEGSLMKLLHALKVETDEWWELVNGCTDQKLVARAKDMPYWSQHKRSMQLEPADRLIEAVLENPVIAMRVGDSFDPWEHYRKGGIVIIEGSFNLSTDAVRSMMGFALFNAIGFKKAGGEIESLGLSR